MEASERMNPSQRYLVLLLGIVSIAVAVTLWGRPTLSHRSSGANSGTRLVPTVDLWLRIDHDGKLVPDMVVVEKGSRVTVSLKNESSKAARVELPGYEDRLAPGRLEPGAVWVGGFEADRPGDDFAWVIDGKTSGRFVVNGSHLIEGHQ
jgi:hypothetical protein